jgi:hypothetical protein
MPGCSSGTQTATVHTVNILIVLDRSSAMNIAPSDYPQTRWEAMKTALGTALNQFQPAINFGLDFFPQADVSRDCTGQDCCAMPGLWVPPTIPVSAGAESVPEILTALDTTSPGGGAPAAAALARALDYYTIGDGRNLCGDKYVLLATLGGANCDPVAVASCDATNCTRNLGPDPDCDLSTNCCSTSSAAIDCLDDQSVIDQIDALRAAGITTIVAGLSSSDAHTPYLNAFAVAGGKPNLDPNAATAYHAVAESAGVTGLADALQRTFVDLLRSCVIQYTTPPMDPERVTVLVDCAIVPREPVDGGDGSYWTLDTSTGTITLGGPICERILDQGAQRIDYIFGCASCC